MADARDNPGYVDGAYLELLVRLTRPVKERSYELLRLRPGDGVLDVGCGPGADTLALARLVGPSGRVVGVDYDPDMIAEARRRAAAEGLDGRIEHLLADAGALPFADGTFAACRCERVVQHLAEPERALAEMVRVVRPGGRLLVIDSDFGTLSVDAPELEVERRLMRLLADRFHHRGYAGRQLFRLLRRQGLKDVQVELFGLPFTDYATMRRGARLDELEALALELGVVDRAQLERWRAGLEAADREGVFFGSLGQVLVVGRV